MAEAQSPSSTSSEPAGGSTTSNNPSSDSSTASGSKEKAVIKVAGTGGGFSFDEFNRALGKETDNTDDREEPEIEEGSGELLDDPKEATEEPRVEDKPLEDEEEDKEAEEEEQEDEKEGDENSELKELEELGKSVRKGGIKAITKDGKPLTLPPDLEIEQNIDGEARRINLREHLNVVAGELTVESRLGKIGSFREQVEKRRQEVEGVHNKFTEDLQTLVSFAKEGKPDLAICFLAEMNGMSPVQMKKQFLKALVAEATKFEGKSEIEIENYYLNLDAQWRDKKAAKQKQKETEQTQASSFVQHVTNELKKEKISPEEFTAISQELKSNGELQGLSQDAALDRVIERALEVKHVSMAKTAIGLVDPQLVNNKKLFELLLAHTHPNKFTVEEMADVLAEYLGKARTRIASSLSRKVRVPQVQARPEKQNGAGKKQKTYRSQGDLQRAFGLS